VSWAGRYPPERVVGHDPAWAGRYAELEAGLVEGLGATWQVEHVGSTSVPGLCAKPVIDLALRVPEVEPTGCWEAFTALGWTRPEPLGDHAAAFVLGPDGVRRAVAHLYSAEAWPDAPLRLFAAWLRGHPTDAAAYARLKQDLVGNGIWGSDYTRAKAAFVDDVVHRARRQAGRSSASTIR